MRWLRPAGVIAALLVMTACQSGESATTTEPAATAAPTTSVPTTTTTTAAPTTSVPATTAAPTTGVPTTSNLEVIEAGVAAFYSGDAERAAELFELDDRTDDQIRAESAYQAAIGGRLDLRCREVTTESFNCTTPYRNAMTEAIGEGGGHDEWRVLVEDGVITQFGFTEHTGLLLDMGMYLASEGRFDGYADCVAGPFPETCATIQIENLDGWAAWRETVEPSDRVETAVESWYGGDCAAAVNVAWGEDTDCSASSPLGQMIAYESMLGAQVSVENCGTATGGEHPSLTCEVHYSNAMSSAVGKPPSVTTREFVLMFGLMTAAPDEQPWYDVDYPEDAELRDSFRRFAEAGELADEYADADCAAARSPECATLIVDNLDAWATWYETNG
jgi:hypothetical protein